MSERVCAVVLTYNRKELLSECLSALNAQTRPLDGIVVVNNASTDGTAEMLAESFATVNALNQHENLGASTGFYLGHEVGVRARLRLGLDLR